MGKGENAVQAAKMRSDMALAEETTHAELRLENHRTSLIERQMRNDIIRKKADAEGASQPFAQHAKSFIVALNDTGVAVSDGLELYRTLKHSEYHNHDTENLASGNVNLFLTSKDVQLNMREFGLGGPSIYGNHSSFSSMNVHG